MSKIENSLLGKRVTYVDKYNASLLYPIFRIPQANKVSMYGYDLWNLYELSWLNHNGKPQVAIGTLVYSASSPKLIESKSLKLYLNSFNNSQFESFAHVKEVIENDVSKAISSKVIVSLQGLKSNVNLKNPDGICLDDIEINVEKFDFENRLEFLQNIQQTNQNIHEIVFSNLLRSNCPITGQPDWGTITIEYSGHKICHKNLLRYILSYRNHNDFHEHCVESIFSEIMTFLKPKTLKVYANYTRRGGIDINPYRFHENDFRMNEIFCNRLIRQ